MTTGEYVVFLLIAVGLTVAVGRVLFLSGQPFLEDVFQDKGTAHSVNVLLTGLFHLLTLGFLALISTIRVPVDGVVQIMVTKLGIVLVVVGVAYGVSMLVLVRIREQRRGVMISERTAERLAEKRRRTRTDPVPPPSG